MTSHPPLTSASSAGTAPVHPPVWEHQHLGYQFSDDPARLNIDAIHDFLCHHSHWATNIPRDTLEKAIRHSLCFGLYQEGQQAGFARAVSDFATFAYFCDVYILPQHRGQGLSSWMIDRMLEHPQLKGLRKYALVTTNAHRVYQRSGFHHLEFPERWLEIHHPDLYTKGPRPLLLDIMS